MFEAFIHSKILRRLLHHLLSRPAQRFYARGLAKELGVSVGPLHRELQRLERLGLLQSTLEANVRYYTVKQDSPLFAELRSASRPPQPESQADTAADPQGVPLPAALSTDAFQRVIRIGWAGVLMAAVLVLVWSVAYFRRMEARLQVFEGVLSEFVQEQSVNRP